MTAKKKPQGRGNGTGVPHESQIPAKFPASASIGQAQRERILAALRRRPQSTEDLRKIGIFQAPARVKELRDRFGFRIDTARVTLVDRDGYQHPRAALYSLLGGPEGAA